MTAVFLVAVSVGLDNFAAAAAYGMASAGPRKRLELVLVFGLFAGGMPLLGLFLGTRLGGVLGGAAAPCGAGLLVLVGAYGLYEAISDRRKQGAAASAARTDRATQADRDDRGQAPQAWQGMRATRLWLTGAALSLDSLVVGLALGAYQVPLAVAVLTFAIVGTGLSLAGMEIGRRLGSVLGELGGLIGSVALIGVGIALGTGLLLAGRHSTGPGKRGTSRT
jgi:manganese efflux pump family protein